MIPSQYAHDVILTSLRRRFNVMDVVWMSKRCRVLTGIFIPVGHWVYKPIEDIFCFHLVFSPMLTGGLKKQYR